MSTKGTSVFKDPEVAATTSTIHDKYVVVATNKAPNNIVLWCIRYYWAWIAHKVILHIQLLRWQKRKSLIITCQSCLLLVPPWKMRIVIFPYCIVYQNDTCVHTNNVISQGASKCSTNPLSKFLTYVFTAVKTDLQKYHETCFSRSGVNQVWILKKWKDLLETLNSKSQYACNSIKTFDFFTVYTTIPHTLLKCRIKQLIQRCFSNLKKNGE